MQEKGEKEAGHSNCQEDPPHLQYSHLCQCARPGFALVRNPLRWCSELEPLRSLLLESCLTTLHPIFQPQGRKSSMGAPEWTMVLHSNKVTVEAAGNVVQLARHLCANVRTRDGIHCTLANAGSECQPCNPSSGEEEPGVPGARWLSNWQVLGSSERHCLNE